MAHRFENRYFLPHTHWVYLNEIVKYFDAVCLLSLVKINDHIIEEELLPIDGFKNVQVKELPFSNSYISSVKYFLII